MLSCHTTVLNDHVHSEKIFSVLQNLNSKSVSSGSLREAVGSFPFKCFHLLICLLVKIPSVKSFGTCSKLLDFSMTFCDHFQVKDPVRCSSEVALNLKFYLTLFFGVRKVA